MKKNTMMRLAAVMLMCVLLTTSVVGGTFAKYVTSAESTDSARVAKWGVDVEVEADTAFATAYGKDDSATTIAQTVVSSTSDKLLAPGTKGTLCTAYITGKPEVAVHITKTPTLVLNGWTTNGTDYYCPLVITVDGTEYYGMDDAYLNAQDPVAAFIAAVEKALSANYEVGPNTDLTVYNKVEWSWAFEGSDDKQTNEKDTALGDKAATPSDITIDFKYVITVTQLD